jgi:hypothetical protein
LSSEAAKGFSVAFTRYRGKVMDNEHVIELIKAISEQGAHLKLLSEAIAKIDERMTKLEALREQDIKQNEKIENIITRLQEGSGHFDKIDERLLALEMQEGKKALDLKKQIAGIVVAVIAGAILSNLGTVLQWVGK